jgi:hypothetical protein
LKLQTGSALYKTTENYLLQTAVKSNLGHYGDYRQTRGQDALELFHLSLAYAHNYFFPHHSFCSQDSLRQHQQELSTKPALETLLPHGLDIQLEAHAPVKLKQSNNLKLKRRNKESPDYHACMRLFTKEE